MIVLTDISEGFENEKKYRLADYFNRWWDEYAKHPTEYITPEQYKAANAIRAVPLLWVWTHTPVPIAEKSKKSIIVAKIVSARRAAGVTRSNGRHG